MVSITIFPKKCPHCQRPMVRVKKMYANWLECENDKCSANIDPNGILAGTPFTYGYSTH